MKIKKRSSREKALRLLRFKMARDKTNPSRLSKWFKLMESKKKLFALEDEIDRLTRELQDRKTAKQ